MLRLVLDSAGSVKPDKTYIVVGRQGENIMEEAAASGAEFIHQKKAKGTVQAVLAAKPVFKGCAESDVLIIPGDMPLLRPRALKALIATHRRRGNALTFMSGDGNPAGVYIFKAGELLPVLSKISKKQNKRAPSLKDAIALLSAAGKKVGAYKTTSGEDIVRIDTRRDFSRAVGILRERKIREIADRGVAILNPSATWIDLEAEIGRDTVIYPGAVIEGRTTIGRHCRIYPGAHIINSKIGRNVKVLSFTVVEDTVIEDDAWAGPFARLRPKTILRSGSRVGNFVEMKNTDFGRGSKAGHLSYLGDSWIGEDVNIGAGTITCNYDGLKKNKTIIESGAFIGSGSELVAPVKVGRGAYVGAGSVITKDVSPGALAVSRGRQYEKPGWSRRRRNKLATKTKRNANGE
jgi:bifunctional UDP-N-acetylglucosamine pyrophosphorylase/glucosamine-1-phosphate N-acetyltransferase